MVAQNIVVEADLIQSERPQLFSGDYFPRLLKLTDQGFVANPSLSQHCSSAASNLYTVVTHWQFILAISPGRLTIIATK